MVTEAERIGVDHPVGQRHAGAHGAPLHERLREGPRQTFADQSDQMGPRRETHLRPTGRPSSKRAGGASGLANSHRNRRAASGDT